MENTIITNRMYYLEELYAGAVTESERDLIKSEMQELKDRLNNADND